MMAQRIDLGTILRDRAAAHPDARFVTSTATGASLSYGEFNARVNAIAHGLAALGVRQGDHVNVMLRNCLEQLELSYALKKLGAVEVAINAEFRGPALARMLELAGAELLVLGGDLLEHVAPLAPGLTSVRRAVLVGDGPGDATLDAGLDERPFDALRAERDGEPGATIADTDVATVIFTSGTTGVSKGCMLPHRALVRTGEVVRDALELTAEDCFYTPYPLFHMRAAYLDVLSALLAGSSVVIAPRFSASRFWRDMVDFDVTVFSLLGTVMQILWKRDPVPEEARHRVRITWGGPINVDRDAFRERFGVAVLPGEGVFGMSETGMLNMSSFDARASGVVQPIFDVRIADDGDDPLPPGTVGEILVRSREPGVMFSGYLGMPEATVAACRNLWFHTGDFGVMDEEGRLSFVGRKKDMVRRGGHNISTWEIEECVDAHPAVAESAAIGVPSELGEEEVKVYVVPRPGASVEPAELRAYCAERMAAFMVPDYVQLIAELPKTSTGKPAKAELAKLHAAGG